MQHAADYECDDYECAGDHGERSKSVYMDCVLAGHVGADFDLEFAKHMVKGHEMAIKEALDACEKTNDPEVKNLADSLITSYRQHLDVAKALAAVPSATVVGFVSPCPPGGEPVIVHPARA